MDLKIFIMKRKSRCQWDWFCEHESHAAGLFVDVSLHIQCNTSSSSGSKNINHHLGETLITFFHELRSILRFHFLTPLLLSSKRSYFFPQKLLVDVKYMLLKTDAWMFFFHCVNMVGIVHLVTTCIS